MTTLGYRLLMVCFALLGAVGVWLAAPRAHELGVVAEMDCRAFLAAPSEREQVRLTNCPVEGPPRGAWVAMEGALLWVEPSLLGEPGGDLQGQVEILRRYESVSAAREDWVMREPRAAAEARRRIWGLLILVPSLLLALLLFRAQRRWTRREEELRGDAAPLTF
ncbi:MAG: hypothetical protein RLP09_25210 [Sandaracinaceae bacterium]